MKDYCKFSLKCRILQKFSSYAVDNHYSTIPDVLRAGDWGHRPLVNINTYVNLPDTNSFCII